MEDNPFSNREIECPNSDCNNYGSFTNCYDDTREKCSQYSFWIKDSRNSTSEDSR